MLILSHQSSYVVETTLFLNYKEVTNVVEKYLMQCLFFAESCERCRGTESRRRMPRLTEVRHITRNLHLPLDLEKIEYGHWNDVDRKAYCICKLMRKVRFLRKNKAILHRISDNFTKNEKKITSALQKIATYYGEASNSVKRQIEILSCFCIFYILGSRDFIMFLFVSGI